MHGIFIGNRGLKIQEIQMIMTQLMEIVELNHLPRIMICIVLSIMHACTTVAESR